MWETKLAGISFLDNFVLNKNLMELSTSYCSKHSKQLFICWTTEGVPPVNIFRQVSTQQVDCSCLFASIEMLNLLLTFKAIN